MESEGKVYVDRLFDCDYCYNTGKVEELDSDNQPSGQYNRCFNCANVPDVDSKGLKY